MKKIALSEIKDELSKYLREAEKEEITITRHGKPAGLLIGFASEDDWFDYQLEEGQLECKTAPGVYREGNRSSSSSIDWVTSFSTT